MIIRNAHNNQMYAQYLEQFMIIVEKLNHQEEENQNNSKKAESSEVRWMTGMKTDHERKAESSCENEYLE